MTDLHPGPLALCCVVALLSLGCLSASDNSLESEVRDRLADAEPPEELVATQESTFDGENTSFGVTQDVWYHVDGRSRTETVRDPENTGTDEINRTITVDDGEQVWTYISAENRVRVISGDELDRNRTGRNNLRQLYSIHDELLAEMEITTVSETTVDGLDTYHLVLERREGNDNEDDGGSSVSVFDAIANPLSGFESGDDGGQVDDTFGTAPQRAEIWFDQEYLFPIKSVIETEEITSETVFRDVEFEPGIPAERFEFEPPENATVEQVDLPEVERYDDVDAASEAAPFEISEPSSVPEEYEFDGATVREFEDHNRTVSTLFYRSSEREFVSVQITDGELGFESGGETVDIGGQSGTYSVSETTSTRRLAWECNGLEYAVSADDSIDRETVLEIGQSIGC